jgi:eukaryotic-like serine/threonine-protein kinase
MSSLDSTAISRTHAPDLIPGYRLEKLVGSGGMGEVHKATQLSLNRTVAIKLLSQQLAQDESFVARFQKEAAALATLHHPNIVSIVDKGSTPTTYYLVMEFVDGASLRERMRAPQEDPLETVRTMVQICRAIEYAHGRGVIHRDLKPENILFDDQAGGIPKVTDFGLASFLEDTSTRFALTSTHVAMGTLSYMAPEQKVDAKTADERADIFALGLIFYEMLVGELPAGSFEPPSRRKPGVDPRLDGIIARCIKQSPSDRYASVSDLLTDLQPLAPQYTTIRPGKLGKMQRLKRAVRRAVRVCLQVVATLLVLTAMGVLTWLYLLNQDKRVPMVPGAALTADLGPPSAQQMAGKVDTRGDERSASLGEGSDLPSLLVSGRVLDTKSRALIFPLVEDSQSRVGLARLDVVNLDGNVARLSARVSAEGPESTFVARLRATLFGPPPEPEAALLLVGSTGRYVALVYNGEGGPLRLDWSLGERRGSMLGFDSPPSPAELWLEVDEEGVLKAFAGSRRNEKRLIAEPLHLGPDWAAEFGDITPKPSFGCIEGTCRAENFSFQVERREVEPEAVAAAPRPAPAPAKVAPAPAKRPATKAAPPSKGKRSK